jgi:hypothetical protein
MTGTAVSLTAAQVATAAILLLSGRRLSRHLPATALALTCATAGITICSLSRTWPGLIIQAADAACHARARRRRSPAPGSLQ